MNATLRRLLALRSLRPWRGLAAVLALLLFSPGAHALCTITCSCSVSTTAVAFGNYNPLSGSAVDSTGTVKVSCGGIAGLLIPYQIDLGKGGGASYAGRRMAAGAAVLAYNLYTDTNRSIVWGDGSASTQSVSGSFTLDVLSTAPPQTATVYARIPGAQTGAVPSTGYVDSISVTLTYY